MATENPVFQVLVPSGNAALLARNQRIDALAVGQMAIINPHTGLSEDGTILSNTQDFMIVVGVNRTGAGGGATLEDIQKSAGQFIQSRHIKSYTAKPYAVGQAKIVDLYGVGAKCETDYTLKIEFRNQKSYTINGFNQFTKSFNFFTGCCTQLDCTSCPTGDCNELIVGMANNINLDPDALVTASFRADSIGATFTGNASASTSLVILIGSTSYTIPITNGDTPTLIAGKVVAQINSQTGSPYFASNVAGALTVRPRTSTSATTTTITTTTAVAGTTLGASTVTGAAVTDTVAFIAANPGVCLALRLTANPTAIKAFSGNINLSYDSARETDIIVSLTDGFTCNGTTRTVQNLAYVQGLGYDVRQEEYIAGGWNGKPGPYRQSAVTGLERGGFESFGVAASKYSCITITYDQESVGGWEEYKNNLETIIYIPCADGTTIVSLTTFLDRIVAGKLGPLADDVASYDCIGTVGEVHTLTPITDGIESLA